MFWDGLQEIYVAGTDPRLIETVGDPSTFVVSIKLTGGRF